MGHGPQRWQTNQRQYQRAYARNPSSAFGSRCEQQDNGLQFDTAHLRVRGLLVRSVLLQVSLPVVRKFVKQVEETALGVKVVKGIKPDQQLVKVVSDQLIELMGGEQQGLVKSAKGPQVNSEFAQCLLYWSAFCICCA